MKIFHFTTLALAAVAALTSCKKDNEDPAKFGVLINRVRWAECNVGTPGNFVATPQEIGMYYRWNSKTGWNPKYAQSSSAAGSIRNNTTSPYDAWEVANDPCPTGWRVPTDNEQRSLFSMSVNWEWVKKNGVNGYEFTDAASGKSIFLPAAGFRKSKSSSSIDEAGVTGYYWSSTIFPDINDAYCLVFAENRRGHSAFSCTRALTVRCVRQ